MKQLVIKNQKSLYSVANNIVKKITKQTAFTDGVLISIKTHGDFELIEVTEKHHHLTFAVIDTVREIAEKYEKDYFIDYNHMGVGFYLDTKPYLAQDNETWLHEVSMVIKVQINQ